MNAENSHPPASGNEATDGVASTKDIKVLPTLTRLLLILCMLLAAGWWTGLWRGDFSVVMLVITVVTFAYWLADALYFLPRRRAMALAHANPHVQEHAANPHLRRPWWLICTAGVFPAAFAIFFVRSFVAEPFTIPSGSMMPTLEIGDVLFIAKSSWGVRFPVSGERVFGSLFGQSIPKRGDIAVFRFPQDRSTYFVKRVIGLPGDTVTYANQTLSINGKAVQMTPVDRDYLDRTRMEWSRQFVETWVDGHGAYFAHKVLVDPQWGIDYVKKINQLRSTSDALNKGSKQALQATQNLNCSWTTGAAGTLSCTVPAGHYFMLGDNRDNSVDSRYWGFVPDTDLVGRAATLRSSLKGFEIVN